MSRKSYPGTTFSRRDMLKILGIAATSPVWKATPASAKLTEVIVADVSSYQYMIVPRIQGQILPVDGRLYANRYPSQYHWGQFMAFVSGRKILYVQTDDPTGTVSDWVITTDKKLHIRFWGPNTKYTVKELYGDYRTVAEEYKKWALLQPWAKRKTSPLDQCRVISTASTRDLTSQIARDQTFFSKFGGDKCVSWLTQWRLYDFDYQYPDYRPADPVAFGDILKSHRAGGHISMPYINGCLWDENHPEYDPNKMIHNIGYSATNPNATVVPFGINRLKYACNYLPAWNERIINARNSLKDADGVLTDGVYIDMSAGTRPFSCYHPDHGHAVGDPWVFQTKVRELFKSLSGVIISEGNAEIYMDVIDAFMPWDWRESGKVAENIVIPLWDAVYGDVARQVGWNMVGVTDPIETDRLIKKSMNYGKMLYGTPWMTSIIQTNLMAGGAYGGTLDQIVKAPGLARWPHPRKPDNVR